MQALAAGWPVGGQLRAEPVDDARNELQGGRTVVPAPGQVGNVKVYTAMLRDVEEALHLRVDVELIPAAVGDVHRIIAILDVAVDKNLQWIFPRHLFRRVGGLAVERPGDVLQPNGIEAAEAGDDLESLAEVLAPAPAIGVEVAAVSAVTVFP